MKMYKILRIPDDLRDALDASDPEATTITEVDVVDADEDWVWVIWPPGQAGVAKMHRRVLPMRLRKNHQGWFDTKEEARVALMVAILERVEELEANIAFCNNAVWRLRKDYYNQKTELEVANDNQD